MDDLEKAMRHYGSVLAQLKIPEAVILVERRDGVGQSIAMSIESAGARFRRKAAKLIQQRPDKDHAKFAIHDLLMDVARREVAAIDLPDGEIAAVAVTSDGRLYVDRISTGERLKGECGPDSPKTFGRLLTAAPDMTIPRYGDMAEALTSVGIGSIVVDLDTGGLSFGRVRNSPVDEDDARGVVNSHADVLIAFANEAVLNAKTACLMSIVSRRPEDCELRHDLTTGSSYLGPRDEEDAFVKVAAMSTTLDPSTLNPSAEMWAHAALDAISVRDEKRLEEASAAFAAANGGDATDMVRYAIGISQREAPHEDA